MVLPVGSAGHFCSSRSMVSSTARFKNAFTDSPCLAAWACMRSFLPLGTRSRISSTFSFCHFSFALFRASLTAIVSPSLYINHYSKEHSDLLYDKGTYPVPYICRFCQLMYGTMYCMIQSRKENSGSVRERQLPYTCAGEPTTYTTDLRPHRGIIIPFCALQCKGFRGGRAPSICHTL